MSPTPARPGALLAVALLVAALLGTACGDGASGVPPTTEVLMDEIATVLDGIHDADSARAAKPRLQALLEKLRAASARARELGASGREQALALTHAAAKRLARAVVRLAGQPDVARILAEELARMRVAGG